MAGGMTLRTPATPGIPAAGPGSLGTLLARNTLTNFAGQAVVAALVLVATPYIVREFGSAAYGVLMLVLTFVSFLGVLQLGLNAGLVRYLAPAVQQGDAEAAGSYLGNTLALFLGLGTLAAAMGAAAGHLITGGMVDLPPGLEHSALVGAYVASLALWVRFPGEALLAVPIAAQRFDLVNLVFLGSEAIRIVLSVAAVWLGYRVEGVCWAIVLANVFFLAAGVVCARRLVPGLSLRPRLDRPALRELLHFSKYVLVASVSSRIVQSVDKVVIGHLLPVRFVAYYDVPYGLGQKVSTLVGNVTSVLFPAASALSAEEARGRLQELYLRGSKVVAGLAALPALLLCLFSDQVLLHWIGPEFAEEAGGILAVVSLGFFFNTLAHVPFVVAQATGHPEISARFSALNAAATLALLFVLVPPFGIMGAAAGFLVTQAAFAPWFALTANRLLGVRFGALVRAAYLPTAAGMLAALGTWAALRGAAHTLAGLALAGFACAVAYAAALAVLAVDGKERAAVRRLLHRRAPRVGALGIELEPRPRVADRWEA
jgi:O-antigen/teichoic acid export membrane protein